MKRMATALALLALASAAPAAANTYPSRPVRVIVPTQAGASMDIIVRLLQPYLEKSLGQPIVVDNRSGASTIIGTDAAAKAEADGYTLLIVPTTFTVNAALNAKLPYDPVRDFQPIAVLVKNPLVFSANAQVPAKSLKEFVELARKEPGKLNYGSSGASTQAHLLLEMWTARAGIKMQHIPYRGGAPAARAVATGEVQLVLLSTIGILPQIQSGTARALASGGLKRDPKLPDVPTAAEAGFPGFEAVQWFGLLAPARTPRPVVEKINAEVNKALRDPDLVAKLATQGAAAAGGTPEEFRALIVSEINNWKETAQRAGITAK